MNYYMPTELCFGEKTLAGFGGKISLLGENALIVTGKMSAIKSGAQEELLEILGKADIKHSIFNKISENPTIDMVMQGVDVFGENDCDFVIGVGGGSPIDAAKAISAIKANKLNKDDIYCSEKIKRSYPIVAIPTTSGTGSEVTPYSVVIFENRKAGFGSPFMFPKISFIDPRYTRSLDNRITRDTAIDALSHLLEGIYSVKRNKIIYPLIYKGVSLIYSSLIKTIDEPQNLVLRGNLMQASLYGGIVIAQTGTTLQHSIGYPLTVEFGTSHGLANGIVMKEIMELYCKDKIIANEIKNLFNYLKIKQDDFYNWLNKFNMKMENRLSDAFIKAKLQEILKSRNMQATPGSVSLDDIESILKRI